MIFLTFGGWDNIPELSRWQDGQPTKCTKKNKRVWKDDKESQKPYQFLFSAKPTIDFQNHIVSFKAF